MGITIVPSTISAAKVFVAAHHRHNKPPQGALFACAVAHDGCIVGVAIVGRPVAIKQQDGKTVEVVRCCVKDGSPKGSCSALYAACWRAARALGWSRLITYTLASESGASLRGAGFRCIGERKKARPEWWQSRPGREAQSVVGETKLLWELPA